MSDEDDIPSRENVPKLSEHPAWNPPPPDIAKEHIAFLDNAIVLAAPPDLFGSQKNPSAWFSLQSSESRNKLAEILFWIANNQDHPLKIDISSRHKKVMELIKERYNDAGVFKEYQRDISHRVKWLVEKATSPKYTTKTIPDDRWFANSSKDNVTLSYAVSNFRNIDLSCVRLKINVLYDPFDGTYRVEQNGKFGTFNSARQVRSFLLVPVSDNFGYEMHRDHFDDFAETVKNDKKRHYDSLLQYYDSFEAQYDPDFRCIDELVDILDTENDDYTREGLRSFNIGHVQRAYFPGCELQRLISLIGDENIGKSSLIKMKAGNLLWDENGGIKAIRWYSNKPIMNPQMSDRDRRSACIGINMFEFDERRGQRAIEAEHFRSFVTSTYDDFRMFMGMEPVRVLRRWDMVASTNHGDYNSDGFIRRDWGINVGATGRRINIPKFIELYPKITAWAVHHVKEGMSAIPDYSLYQKAKIKQRTRIRQTDTMDFLEPVFAFAHLYDSEETRIVSKAGAIRFLEKYHLSYKDDKETKQRTYMIDQTGLSNFASDYKRFYNRSGNTDKHAIKNDILNVEVRPVVDEGMVDTEICYQWKPMTKPVNMWSTFLNRAIRGYIIVVEAPHVVLMEAFAFNVMGQHLPFIEAVLNINKTFEDVSKLKEQIKK
jgi:Virulence-associated protein E